MLKLRLIWNWIVMIYYWTINKLGIKLSEEPIPENTFYCYKDDTPCKYYKSLGKDWTGCGYLGEIMNFDALHWDQCKICGIKDDYIENEEDYVSDDYVE